MNRKIFDAVAHRAGVYVIHNRIENRSYIGRGFDIGITRWRPHYNDLNKNQHFNRHLQEAWNRDGKEAFDWLIVKDMTEELSTLTKEAASTALDKAEAEEADRRDRIYNIRTCGLRTVIPSAEIKNKISAAHRTPENRTKRSALMKELLSDPTYKEAWDYNMHSEEMRERQKQTRQTPEFQEKWRGIVESEEFSRKVSMATREAVRAPGVKEKQSKAISEAAKRPGEKEKRSERSKKAARDPLIRAKWKAAYLRTCEERKIKEAANPQLREQRRNRQRQGLLEAHAKRREKEELDPVLKEARINRYREAALKSAPKGQQTRKEKRETNLEFKEKERQNQADGPNKIW